MQRDRDILISCEPGVYTPAEDTLLMLGAVNISRDERVLEMGCGTGMVSVHCAKGGAVVTAADVNPEAVKCTKTNASRNDVLVNVVESDLFENIRGTFDLILFNPPYLRGEGRIMEDKAWAGGPNGTETLFRFLEAAVPHLDKNGRIIVIVSSDMDQAALDKVLRPFHVKELASMRLFFEELRVLELRPVSGRPRSVF
ncbi:MAG: putative S-adenosylmethionine-dependent methyltransferase [Methanomassiliicoccales archaeon PtaU1.Bin124]|nr:MAG: putative S-adenosylmethionine-dependent methyltransferase [Methanomassiliicoccales archaeon PtaU1.Bin124]